LQVDAPAKSRSALAETPEALTMVDDSCANDDRRLPPIVSHGHPDAPTTFPPQTIQKSVEISPPGLFQTSASSEQSREARSEAPQSLERSSVRTRKM